MAMTTTRPIVSDVVNNSEAESSASPVIEGLGAPVTLMARPINITVVHGFTWPEPEERIELTADAAAASSALLRTVAEKVGYMFDDIMLVGTGSSSLQLSVSEKADAPTLAGQGVTAGDKLRLVRRGRFVAVPSADADKPSAASAAKKDPLYPPGHALSPAETLPSSSTSGTSSLSPATIDRSRGVSSERLASYFRDSAFVVEWARDAPRLPVLVRSMQLREGVLPSLNAPSCLDECVKARNLNEVLVQLGAFESDTLSSLSGDRADEISHAVMDAAAEAAARGDVRAAAALHEAKAAKLRGEESEAERKMAEQEQAAEEAALEAGAAASKSSRKAGSSSSSSTTGKEGVGCSDEASFEEEDDWSSPVYGESKETALTSSVADAMLEGCGGQLGETPPTSAVLSPILGENAPILGENAPNSPGDAHRSSPLSAKSGESTERARSEVRSSLLSETPTSEPSDECDDAVMLLSGVSEGGGEGGSEGGSEGDHAKGETAGETASDSVAYAPRLLGAVKRAAARAARAAADAQAAEAHTSNSGGGADGLVGGSDLGGDLDLTREGSYGRELDAIAAALSGDSSFAELGFLAPLSGGHKAGGSSGDAAGKNLDELFGIFFDDWTETDVMPQGKKAGKTAPKKAKGTAAGAGGLGGDESSSSKANRPKSGKGSRGGGAKAAGAGKAVGGKGKHSAMSSALDNYLGEGLVSMQRSSGSSTSSISGISRQSTQPESERGSFMTSSVSSRSSSPSEILTQGPFSLAASPTREGLAVQRKAGAGGAPAGGKVAGKRVRTATSKAAAAAAAASAPSGKRAKQPAASALIGGAKARGCNDEGILLDSLEAMENSELAALSELDLSLAFPFQETEGAGTPMGSTTSLNLLSPGALLGDGAAIERALGSVVDDDMNEPLLGTVMSMEI